MCIRDRHYSASLPRPALSKPVLSRPGGSMTEGREQVGGEANKLKWDRDAGVLSGVLAPTKVRLLPASPMHLPRHDRR
eukprot:1605325-Rhodomonas_salina.4